jgi:superkiller protein 3
MSDQEGLKSAYDIHGAGAVACYITDNNPKFTFPTCSKKCSSHPRAIKYLQKYYFYFPLCFITCNCPEI